MRAKCNCKCYAYAACNKRIRYIRSHAFSLAPKEKTACGWAEKNQLKCTRVYFQLNSPVVVVDSCVAAVAVFVVVVVLPKISKRQNCCRWAGLFCLSTLPVTVATCSALPLLNLRHGAANFNSVICAVSLSQVVCVLCALSHRHLDRQPTTDNRQPATEYQKPKKPKTKFDSQIRLSCCCSQSQPLSHIIHRSKRNKRRPVNTANCINYLTSCLPRPPPPCTGPP